MLKHLYPLIIDFNLLFCANNFKISIVCIIDWCPNKDMLGIFRPILDEGLGLGFDEIE
jgi:hypothetical protein